MQLDERSLLYFLAQNAPDMPISKAYELIEAAKNQIKETIKAEVSLKVLAQTILPFNKDRFITEALPEKYRRPAVFDALEHASYLVAMIEWNRYKDEEQYLQEKDQRADREKIKYMSQHIVPVDVDKE